MFKKRRELEKRILDLEGALVEARRGMCKDGKVQIKENSDPSDFYHLVQRYLVDARTFAALADHVKRHENALQKLLLIPGLVEVSEIPAVPAHFELPVEKKPERNHGEKGPR